MPELEVNHFGEEDIFAIHLSLEEAFANAVKHGNKSNPDKKIKVEYLVDSEKVEICLTDEGEGFCPTVVPDPRCGENLYRGNGRGLLLIRSFMDICEFSKSGNSVRMVKRKKKPGCSE